MSIMNNVKEGADLTHPKPTAGYLVGAVVAIVVLAVAFWLYGMLKGATHGVTSGVKTATSGIESQASKQLEGFL